MKVTTETKLLVRLYQIGPKINNLGGLSGITDEKLKSLQTTLEKTLKHIKTLRSKNDIK